ncbi:MAG: peptidase S10, partial [Gemmatimonadales bacterium]
RGERETVGRYDSRIIGLNGNASATREDYDPSDAAPTGAFMSSFMRYLQNDLNYTSDLQYYLGGHTGRWDYSNFGNSFANETDELRTAMAKNPYLHVMVGAGYYDMATPFANAEYTFKHLGFDKTYSDRVKFEYYQSGHMAYLNQSSAKELKQNFAAFVASTEHETKTTP